MVTLQDTDSFTTQFTCSTEYTTHSTARLAGYACSPPAIIIGHQYGLNDLSILQLIRTLPRAVLGHLFRDQLQRSNRIEQLQLAPEVLR